MNNINIIYNKTLFIVTSLLIILSTITFSWIPLIGILPILLILNFFKILYVSPKILPYLVIILLFSFILYTLNHQTIYIEWVRNILIAFLIPSVYLSFTDIKWEQIYKYLLIMFYSSFFVVLFIVLILVPQDFELFFGERRGFIASEFLIFGREYPFSLGVTHLNVYVTFIMTFLMIQIIHHYKYMQKIYVIFFLTLIVLISLSTQSRSPILFLMIIFLIYRQYIFSLRKNKFTYFIIRVFILSTFVSVVILIGSVYYDAISNSERLNDMSRFIFYIKGWEHMLDEPFGNSLLYTDPLMPLLNYHNTFLAFGNRIGLYFFIFLIGYFIYLFIEISLIKDNNMRYTVYLILYFVFHNFMIEDIIKFDYFVLILIIALYPITKSLQKEAR